MIIITYYILDFEQAPNCITNMPKRSALEAGLKDLVTPSGKKVRDLLKSVRKRSTSVEVETDDILFLSPLNFPTLSTRIWSYTSEAFFAKAAVPSLILIFCSSIIFAIFLYKSKLDFS